MGIPKPIAFEYLCKDYKIDFKASLIHELTTQFEERLIAAYEDPVNVEPMPFAEEVFRELHKNGCQVALDTGFSKVITATIVRTLDWGRLIDVTISSDEVNRGRPYPDMVFEAMAKTGVKSHAMVAKVGDTISDLSEGYAAGCGWVIGVTTGACSKEEFKRFPHTHIVDDLSVLLNIFD
jgi:phosphonatase-like hydrolase